MMTKQNNDVALDLKKRETERGGNCFLDKKLCDYIGEVRYEEI